MRSCFSLLCVGLLALVLPLPARGQFLRGENLPTTEPTTTTSPSIAELRHLIVELADEDADVREAAHAALLNLRREDLPALKAAAAAQAPLLPGQLFPLHDAVLQAYLASEPFQSGGSGFLGIRWPDPGVDNDLVHDLGLVVVDRIPGFCAYRMLRPGDIILRLLDHPEIDVRNRMLFTQCVAGMQAGQPLRMAVLRQAAIVELTIVLDPRPTQLQNQAVDVVTWLKDRAAKANDYWSQQFSCFVPPEMASPAPAPATQP